MRERDEKFWMAERAFAKSLDLKQRELLKALLNHDEFSPDRFIGKVLDEIQYPLTNRPYLDVMVEATVDYALGRMTSAPSMARDELKTHWADLQDETKERIKNKIKTAINKGEAGMYIDVHTWEDVLDFDNASNPKI